MTKRSTISESQTLNLVDAEIVDGGVLSTHQTATAPPAYRGGGIDFYEVDNIDINQLGNAPNNRIAMSFSMDEGVLPEAFQPTSKCQPYLADGDSLSSHSNNFPGAAPNKITGDQPYLANPRTENGKQKGYYDYV